MKHIRAAVALFLLAVFLAAGASANTSSINPNVPAQNSPLSSSVLRGNFGNAFNDENILYGMLALSSNQLLGTVNAGNAGPLNLPTCSTGALSWTPGTGFGCNALNGLVSPITQNLVFTGQHAINLNVGTLPTKQSGTVIQVGNADTIASRIENDAFAAPAYFTALRFDGTNVSPTTLQANDEMGGFNAWGYNGSSAVGSRGTFRVYASQNWTGSAQGTYAEIGTTLNNTTSMAVVCRFENDGGVTCPATVTGGDQGAGRINAAGLYVNGVAVSTGSNALSSITAALASNTIENGANPQVWNFDGLSTQTALGLSSTSLSTGQLFNSTVNNAGSTGYAGYFTNNGTAAAYGIYASETGASNTGYAGYFSNTATTTGYALYANGAAKVAGNLTVAGALAVATTGVPPAGGVAIYSDAANTLKLTTSGVRNDLYLSTTGSLGIGTATPAYTLDVNSGATNFGINLSSSNTNGTSVQVINTSVGGHAYAFSSSGSAASVVGCFSVADVTANDNPLQTCGTSKITSVLQTGVYAWNNSTTFGSATYDLGLSRGAAGILDGGNGSAGSTAGGVKTTAFVSAGTKFTASGCSNSATTGGATAGTITLGANSCSVTITLNGATGFTAPNGWDCEAKDLTAPTVMIGESPGTTTTCVLVIPAGAGATDVISFHAMAY